MKPGERNSDRKNTVWGTVQSHLSIQVRVCAVHTQLFARGLHGIDRTIFALGKHRYRRLRSA